MMTAWMSTGSLGMVVARYLRGVSKGQKLWGKDVWFLVRQDEDDGSESSLFSTCPCLTCLPGPCHGDECDHSCHSCRLHPALLLRPDLVWGECSRDSSELKYLVVFRCSSGHVTFFRSHVSVSTGSSSCVGLLGDDLLLCPAHPRSAALWTSAPTVGIVCVCV